MFLLDGAPGRPALVQRCQIRFKEVGEILSSFIHLNLVQNQFDTDDILENVFAVSIQCKSTGVQCCLVTDVLNIILI